MPLRSLYIFPMHCLSAEYVLGFFYFILEPCGVYPELQLAEAGALSVVFSDRLSVFLQYF